MLKVMWKDIHQSYFVALICIGIIIGAILALIFRIDYFGSWIWIMLIGLLTVFVFLKPKSLFIIVALMIGMILVFFRVAMELRGKNYIRSLWGETVLVEGKIEGDPNLDEKGTKIKIVDLRFGEEKISARGSVYASLKLNDEIRRSDEVILSGMLTEGFGIYAGYMYLPRIVKIRRSEPGDMVLVIRDWFAGRIRRLIPKPEVDLGLSYLLGMKTGLSEELSANLRMVGLVHIVVASGTHLSILVEIARKIFGKISRFAGLMFSVLFILFFMALVGWTPSILRAGIMALLSLLVWYYGREIAPWRLIVIVAAITLMKDPMYLINLGWLLSFASYAGIMILGPKLTRFFYGDLRPNFIASMIITTISATLMTLPITLYYFGTISLISILANLLILPTLPIVMGLVFLVGIVCGAFGVEALISFLATKILDFHIMVVDCLSEMQQFIVEIQPYQTWVFAIYMLLISPFIIGFVRRKLCYNKKHEYND